MTSIYCPYCGSDNIDTLGRCSRCGNYYQFVRQDDSGYDPIIQLPITRTLHIKIGKVNQLMPLEGK